MRALLYILLIGTHFLNAQQLEKTPAFPGAMGFGKYTTGGRGGKVLIVDNLEDSGPGSLRHAINQKGPRIITFAISGTIQLKSEIEITEGDLTIAGQTAPGDGICIRDYAVKLRADNLIIRYLRFRLGDETNQEEDAINGSRMENVIIDHCSISWGIDECASFYYNKNFTFQWCIVSEGLNASIHTKGEHGYGGIWGGTGASFMYNLIASHKSRMPRFSGSSTVPNPEEELVEFYNNVIYNWRDNNVYGGEKGQYNVLNNYFKAGPATKASAKESILDPSKPYGQFYFTGNELAGNEKVTSNNKLGVKKEATNKTLVKNPFDTPLENMQSAKEACYDVLEKAGASLSRDTIDARIVSEVMHGNSRSGQLRDGIIDSQKQVGGWPELLGYQIPIDSDKDGMPDEWEITNGLNPHDPSDACAFTLDKSYTNVEVYINRIVE